MSEQKKGILVYHGGRRFLGPVEIQPRPASKLQGGPGFYATTNLATAQEYARGGGIVYRMTLDPDTRFHNDQGIPLADAIAWAGSRAGLRHRADLLADLNACAERLQPRLGDGYVDAFSLMNLCVNYGVLSGEHGPSLASWMVEHGIDAEIQRARRHNEEWVLIFNPRVIIHKEALSMSDKHDYELPRIAEQLRALSSETESVLPVPAP